MKICVNPAGYHVGTAYLTGSHTSDLVAVCETAVEFVSGYIHATMPGTTLANANVLPIANAMVGTGNCFAFHVGAVYLTGNHKVDFVAVCETVVEFVWSYIHAAMPSSTLSHAMAGRVDVEGHSSLHTIASQYQ
ncbi:hypothetical protein FOZ63_018868 [Perkinsus olseni]|uniref:Uncharacterized protein n=1 Tax=Perkinsus olseni TaxID=32597 RepID=A0A7J6QQD8_PEROL|nr:hypothetical protein FOZ63_018868 [Perkinsus olseni]KAF4753332.1 hypothetical protein FOZ62_029953 [Perkinsus olseni]